MTVKSDNACSEDTSGALALSPDMAALSYVYLNELMMDGPSFRPIKSTSLDKVSSVVFDFLPVPSHCKEFIAEDIINNPQSVLSTSMITSSNSDKIDPLAVRTEDYSGDFVVNNPSNQWPRGYCITSATTDDVEVVIKKSADDSSETLTVICSSDEDTSFLAYREKGDWLEVVGDWNEDGSDVKGWVRFRLDGEIFLERDDTVDGCVPAFYNIIDVDDSNAPIDVALSTSGETNGSAKVRKEKHEMYKVGDSTVSSDTNSLGVVESLSLLRSHQNHLERSMSDFAITGAIGYARKSVNLILSKWNSVETFKISDFGGLSNLLSYMNTAYESEESGTVTALKRLKTLLLDVLTRHDDSQDILPKLMSFVKAQFFTSGQPSTPSRAVAVAPVSPPVSRAHLRVIETEHPYEIDVEMEFSILIPKAKYLRLFFDPKSSTDGSNSEIHIKDDEDTKLYRNKIGGIANNQNKHWPGVNVPAVKIDGDSCFITFDTSDASVRSASIYIFSHNPI